MITDFHSAHSIRCTTWYIEYREICSLNKVKDREQFANPAKSELQRPNGFPGVCRRIMSCSFCISISGTDLRNLAYAFVCQIGCCCCCLCRNYLNEITKTYAAGNARWGIIRACPETDLMLLLILLLSKVADPISSLCSRANNIVNCFRFSALMGITAARHTFYARCAFAFELRVVDETWTKSFNPLEDTPNN